MSAAPKIPSEAEAWEVGELGRSEEHASRVTDVNEAEIDEALELQLISVRLQRTLIDSLKTIARLNGIGYQPLMRQVLHRFVDCEMKRIVNDMQASRGLAQKLDPRVPSSKKRTGEVRQSRLKKAA